MPDVPDPITTPAGALDALDVVEAGIPDRHEAREQVGRLRAWVRASESRAALAGLLDRVDGSMTAARDELGQWRPVVAPVLQAHAREKERQAAREAGQAGILALAKTPAGYALALALAGAVGGLVQWATGSAPTTAPTIIGGAHVETEP